jgi:hypothetical protein
VQADQIKIFVLQCDAFDRQPVWLARLLFMAVSRGPDIILFSIAKLFCEALKNN